MTALFAKEKIFPPTFSQLISVGEQTGSLDSMFASVAKYYEEEFDTVVSNLSSFDRAHNDRFYGPFNRWINACLILSNIQCWCNNGSIITIYS